MVNLTIAEATQGWMSHKELTWLAQQAQKHQTIVEVGCYLGRSTRALGDNTSGVVYAIDDFKGPRDMVLPDAIRHNVFSLFRYNVGSLIQENKVIPVIGDHSNAALLEVQPDMVFIDGSHLYQDVKRDIDLWKSRLIKGGLLCGHDIEFSDVIRAVQETVGEYKVGFGTTIWYVTV